MLSGDEVIVLAWYFMAASVLPYGGIGVTTNGPFPSLLFCKNGQAFVRVQQPPKTRYPVELSECWESPEPKEKK